MIDLDKGEAVTLETGGAALARTGVGWEHTHAAGFAGGSAAAVQFAGSAFSDIAYFNNLATRDGSTTHLGDYTSGQGAGDDETVSIDLTRAHERIDTILFLVTSYQGHWLEYVRNAYFRLVDDADGEAEVARFTITIGVRETGLVMAGLVRLGAGWQVHAIGSGVALKTPTDDVESLAAYL